MEAAPCLLTCHATCWCGLTWPRGWCWVWRRRAVTLDLVHGTFYGDTVLLLCGVYGTRIVSSYDTLCRRLAGVGQVR